MSDSDCDLSNYINDTENVPDSTDDIINNYQDDIHNMIQLLQEYCQDHCLPIFNRYDTCTIIMDNLL